MQKPFSHGATGYFSDAKAREWLTEVVGDAKCIVGHSLKSDRDQLRRWGWAFPRNSVYVDTATWSRQMYTSNNPLKLGILASRMGVDCSSLASLHNLKALFLDGNPIADLPALPALRYIGLAQTNFTDFHRFVDSGVVGRSMRGFKIAPRHFH